MSEMIITSRQNPRVKGVCALCDRREREERGLFRFDGIKLFFEAARFGIEIDAVYLRASSSDAVKKRLGELLLQIPEEKIILVGDDVFEKMSEEKSPEGIITVAKYIDKFHKIATINRKELPEREERVLLAESLRDPGNLGTIIRSAAALGIHRLVLSSDCADIYNPKTIRAAMGGLFRIDIDRVDNAVFTEYISALRESGRRVFAASLDKDAAILGELECRVGDCFVIGNEGHGLSREVISACDRSVIIPMSEGSESLNAAAASVILIWEMRRAK